VQHEYMKIKLHAEFLIYFRCNNINEMFMLCTNLRFTCTLVLSDRSRVGEGALAGVY
jgi:hypothetical protein